MQNLPLYVPLVFVATVMVAVWIFYKATNNSTTFLLITTAWVLLQSALGLEGFYQVGASITPPRFPLLILPPVLAIATLFFTPSGKVFLDGMNIRTLTLFHIVRIPVEVVLYWLFVAKAVPELMTFEGRNFDILSGLTAPFIYYFGFVVNKLPKSVLILWNLLCLGLLMNIVFYAALSVPTTLQQFAFEQPNIAFQYIPFLLLPTCVAPLAFFANAIALRQLLAPRKSL
jgi:hypothetical protein